MKNMEFFPDGTPIDEWFYEVDIPDLERYKKYNLNDYGIFPDGTIHTQKIQSLIDDISNDGGGILVVPDGEYVTGALFFKQGVHLCVEKGGVLKGSGDVLDYPICDTRIEGESCKYYSALINADGLDGFMMFGDGVIDGNGLHSWRAFWKRREWNPECTNKDEQRPRLVYVSNSKNVIVANLKLQNSHFWTNHIYKCDHVKFIGCRIYAPNLPVPAPSSDAIDIDACSDVLVKNCYMEVNDDAVVLKGGKGEWADVNPDNGANERILVEDCEYRSCHACLTCGSESVHNKNILVRRIKVDDCLQLLHLKLRPDTPQHYEYIKIENANGSLRYNFMNISPWTQFSAIKGRKDKPVSKVENITVQNCSCSCETFLVQDVENMACNISGIKLDNLDILIKNKEA